MIKMLHFYDKNVTLNEIINFSCDNLITKIEVTYDNLWQLVTTCDKFIFYLSFKHKHITTLYIKHLYLFFFFYDKYDNLWQHSFLSCHNNNLL